MAKYKVTLSIGFPSAAREDEIEVSDEELAGCLNADQKEELLNDYWQEWAWDRIDGRIELID